jgi:hypothetical protein
MQAERSTHGEDAGSRKHPLTTMLEGNGKPAGPPGSGFTLPVKPGLISRLAKHGLNGTTPRSTPAGHGYAAAGVVPADNRPGHVTARTMLLPQQTT